MDNLQHFRRTDYCGTFTAANVGQEISVCGWVQRQRNLGSLIFVDLRDRTGLLQLAFDDSTPRDLFEKAASRPGGVCHRRQGAGPGAGVQESTSCPPGTSRCRSPSCVCWPRRPDPAL